jgi:hypothetical protein
LSETAKQSKSRNSPQSDEASKKEAELREDHPKMEVAG